MEASNSGEVIRNPGGAVDNVDQALELQNKIKACATELGLDLDDPEGSFYLMREDGEIPAFVDHAGVAFQSIEDYNEYIRLRKKDSEGYDNNDNPKDFLTDDEYDKYEKYTKQVDAKRSDALAMLLTKQKMGPDGKLVKVTNADLLPFGFTIEEKHGETSEKETDVIGIATNEDLVPLGLFIDAYEPFINVGFKIRPLEWVSPEELKKNGYIKDSAGEVIKNPDAESTLKGIENSE